jgi:hypothetical protein
MTARFEKDFCQHNAIAKATLFNECNRWRNRNSAQGCASPKSSDLREMTARFEKDFSQQPAIVKAILTDDFNE